MKTLLLNDQDHNINFLIKSNIGISLQSVFGSLNQAGIEAYVVGGFVRDFLLNRPSADIDIEVFGCTSQQLEIVLETLGNVNKVGKEFGVYKLKLDNDLEFDFTLARKENRVGVKHTDFEVELSEDFKPEDVVTRRDYTINALYLDPLKGEVYDYVGGIDDLLILKTLRHIDTNTFVEDPLRVLRGFQFAGRFELVIYPETAQLCKKMWKDEPDISIERINSEWKKWATKAVTPSYGLRFLRDTGWINNHPELSLLLETPQDVIWHPEGRDESDPTKSRNDSAWIHTVYVCDTMRSSLYGHPPHIDKEVMMMVALCHDMGKVDTTIQHMKEGVERYSAHGHAEASVARAKTFLKRIGYGDKFINKVLPLVKYHMAHSQEFKDVKKAAEKLAYKLQPCTIEELNYICLADCGGRPPLSSKPDQCWLDIMDYAERHNLLKHPPKILVNGDVLIRVINDMNINIVQSKYGEILERTTKAQLEQKFQNLNDGEIWLKAYLKQNYENRRRD